MTLFSFGNFCDSWRSRFLSGRKVWHSHYRGYLLGYRDNYTTVSFFYQLNQLQRSLHLLKVIFSRGGHAWTFNILHRITNYTDWGAAYHSWCPGQFSNSWLANEQNKYLRTYRQSLARQSKVVYKNI